MTGRNALVAERIPTRSEALDAFAAAFKGAVAARAAMTIREAAEAAYYPGHPLGSVEALEEHIAERRTRQQVRPAALAA